MRSKKISSSSSKSKIPTKDLTKSKSNNQKTNIEKLKYDYNSNTSLDINKENIKMWEILFKNLLVFLKKRVSVEILEETEKFLRAEIIELNSRDDKVKDNQNFKIFEEILNSIFKDNTNLISNNNKEIPKDKKFSIERNNYINQKDIYHSTSSANHSQDLKLNENTSKNFSKLIENTKSSIPSYNTNISINTKEYNKKTKLSTNNNNNNLKSKIQNILKNTNTNTSQITNPCINKHISPNNSNYLIANKLQSNLKKLASKTNSNSRSISDSKDSLTNKNGKKSITENSNVKIGLSVSNSNANEYNIQIPRIEIPSVKFPNTRGYNQSNMFSKFNTRLKKKTGFSPDDIEKRFEINSVNITNSNNNNEINQYNSNKSYIGAGNIIDLKISNPLEYKPITPQIESAPGKINKSLTSDTEKKFSFPNNVINSKLESQEKLKNYSKSKNISRELKNLSTKKSPVEKSIKNKSHILTNNFNNYNSTFSNKENVLNKKFEKNSQNLKIPVIADVYLNSNDMFKNTNDNPKEMNNMITKKQNRIIELTFGNKETATGRFLGEKENEKNLALQGEDEEKIKPEIFNEIKLNLDGNFKNIFNFSYENFNNVENSESLMSSYVKSEIGEINDNLKDESIRSCKYQNEIAFDENEERMKNFLFKKQNSIK